MSRVLGDMDSEVSARQEAEAWFARLMAPDCTQAERQAFERWRARTPGNAQAYAATERLWERLDGLEDDEVIGPHAQAALEPEPAPMADWAAAVRHRSRRAPPRSRSRWRVPAALAVGVLACAIGLRFVLPLLPGAEPRHYLTAAQPETVTLADGSRVQMDLSTRIEVRMNRRARGVELLQGRAIFDVAHDAGRPFSVETGHGRVTALGTRFQVDREADRVTVTLVEGAISVGGQDGAADLRLAPGEQVRYSPQRAQWSRHSVDTAAATSWSQGFHVFSATPLAEVVREINRYSPVKLRLAEPSLDTLALSGNFKTGNAETIAAALPAVLPVTATRTADEIVLAPRH